MFCIDMSSPECPPADSTSSSFSSGSSSSTATPILHIPGSSIYALGDPHTAQPIIRDVSWTIRPNEAWAILSAGYGSSKRTLFRALLGQRRIHPAPPNGIFPFLGHRDPSKHVSLVGFGRRRATEFFDYTARYGAVRDEDNRTLREVFFPETARQFHKLALPHLQSPSQHDNQQVSRRHQRFEEIARALNLTELLDLPIIALSNGQTRRARIAKALLHEPQVLLLDEPLTGLDVETRELMLRFLRSVHTSQDRGSTHIILGMRNKDPLPEWITHVALVTPHHTVRTGTKKELAPEIEGMNTAAASWLHTPTSPGERPLGYELVAMSNLSVQYGDRQVLKNINWTIHENSRWHLMGENGAGKTTLLAMLTGEHPQSFSQSDRLRLFGRPRGSWPTVQLNARIGRVSPELHNAFPKKHGMTVWEVIGTGFTGEFVPRGRMRVGYNLEDGTPLEPGSAMEFWRLKRMWQVLEGLGTRAWAGRLANGNYEAEEDKMFAKRNFVDLSPGEQSIVLLMRALVSRPPLVLLDEVWSGMDESMVQAVWRYLADGAGGLLPTQACVVISHWEDEVPWSRQDGVKRFLLKDGEGHEVQ